MDVICVRLVSYIFDVQVSSLVQKQIEIILINYGVSCKHHDYGLDPGYVGLESRSNQPEKTEGPKRI